MKQALTAFFLLVLTLAIFPVAHAEETAIGTTATATTVDADTQREIEDMDNGHGAKVRLLQLERQLQRKVIEANTLISALENRTNSTNLTQLKDIVSEIEVMIGQVKAAQANASNNSQQAVDIFVTIKHDAKELIKQFRDAAKNLVTKEDREAIKNARENADKSDLQEINARIESTRNEFRADRLADSLERAGIADAALIAKVRAGTISFQDAREEVKAQLKAMTPAERSAAVASIEEDGARRRVKKLAHIDKIENKIDDVQSRMLERMQRMEDSGRKVAADRIRKQLNRSENRMERLDEREDRIETRTNRSENRTENRMERADDRMDRREDRMNETNRTSIRGPRQELLNRIETSNSRGSKDDADNTLENTEVMQ